MKLTDNASILSSPNCNLGNQVAGEFLFDINNSTYTQERLGEIEIEN